MLRPWPIYNKNIIPNTSVGWKTIYLHLKSSGYTRSERLLEKNIYYIITIYLMLHIKKYTIEEIKNKIKKPK